MSKLFLVLSLFSSNLEADFAIFFESIETAG